MAWGDVHYNLFDGGRIDFQGECKYTMSKSNGEFPDVDCFFQLDVKNERRNSKPVSYTRRAYLKISLGYQLSVNWAKKHAIIIYYITILCCYHIMFY